MKLTKRNILMILRCSMVAVILCLCITALSENAYAVAGKDGSGGHGGCRSHVFELIKVEDMPSEGAVGIPGTSKVRGKNAKASGSTDSYIPLVVIVIGFQNLPYKEDYDWSEAIFTGEWCLRRYYEDMSFGKFTFEPVCETSESGEGNSNTADSVNDGIIHVTLEHEKQYAWDMEDYSPADIEMADVFHDAIIEAANYMDFGEYDTDGDGTISNSELAVSFVVAGLNSAYGHSGGYGDYMYTWPHAEELSILKKWYPDAKGPAKADDVWVDGYIAITEQFKDKSNTGQSGTGVLAHELGHYLGLPDLYNTGRRTGKWSSYAVDYLSLMDSGGYGTDKDGGERPFSLDIWSRVMLGWVEPVVSEAGTDENYSTGTWKLSGSHAESASEDEFTALKLESGIEGEYYLVENRRFTNWDEGMGDYYKAAASEGGADYGGGFILWHIDDVMYNKYKARNTVNNPTHHPAVMPLFVEYDKDGEPTLIGTKPSLNSNPFFSFSYEGLMGYFSLPVYADSVDAPADRRPTLQLQLVTVSESAPVMEIHRHAPVDISFYDEDLVAYAYMCCDNEECYDHGFDILIDCTDDVVTEVVKKPSTTETGVLKCTFKFRTLEIGEYTGYEDIPVLDDETVAERNAALEVLREKIIAARADLKTGGYTEESSNALRKAIEDAIAIFDDDTAVAEDVKAVQAVLIRAWGMLELEDSSEAEEEAARREALCQLADCLSSIYSAIDPDRYRPEAYEEFTAVTDRAYQMLEDAEASASALQNMKTEVMIARTALEKEGRRLSLEKASLSATLPVTYNGKAHTPDVTVTLAGRKLEKDSDYTLSYSNNTDAGTAFVIVHGCGDYSGTLSGTFTINKAANTLAVRAKTASVKYRKLRRKDQKLAISKVISFIDQGQGSLNYTKVKGNRKISVNKTSGKITVKKGLKKGTYRVKVNVTAAGDSNCRPSDVMTVTFRIKVK